MATIKRFEELQFDSAYVKSTDIKKLINGFIAYLSTNHLNYHQTNKSIDKTSI